MTNTKELLAQLNALRARKDLKPIKTWKASRAKLEADIKALTPTAKRSTNNHHGVFADWCRSQGLNPKVARAKLRKSGLVRADGATRHELTPAVIALFKKS